MSIPSGRSFSSADAQGGLPIEANHTALVLIEYQNEFATEKGKLHDSVKFNMEETNMLENTVKLCDEARDLGMKVIHAPISFSEDMSDNPNKGQGILKGCADGALFVRGTWNAAICDSMTPKDGDLIVTGKKGLDAFPGSNLEELLYKNEITTIALGGFLTNCCVESTMRTAFEKGFNVVTLKDCTATTSREGYEAAVEGTYPMFSSPMTSGEFIEAAKGARGVSAGRTFSSADANGGESIDSASTALVMIEYQNEFATEGGKLHDSVKFNMDETNMLENTVAVCEEARKKGIKVIHAPITFSEDMSDNPNKGQGILKGCADGALFVRGTWNAEICEPMKPKDGDLIVDGKRGLDAFPGSNLEELLTTNGIKTIALGGFLTNCCVESTMRTAFEKGFNVVTLKDCTATNSSKGYKAAIDGTFPMFSTPMTSGEFIEAAK